MDESERQAKLTAIFKELLRALTMIRELGKMLESIAREMTELENRKETER